MLKVSAALRPQYNDQGDTGDFCRQIPKGLVVQKAIEASIGPFLSILDLLGCWQLVESLIPPLLELLPANETALDDSGLGGEYLP